MLPTTSARDKGKVDQIINYADNNRTQNFTYDSLNRISQAYTSGPNWGEAYLIDPWGNLYQRNPVTGKTNYELLSTTANAKNQLANSFYDAAGNTTNNTAYVYDAENRVASVAIPATSYVYDGDGKRLIKCAGTYPSCSSGTLYWTGTGSDALAESDLSGNLSAEYIFFNGMRVVRKDLPSGTIHDYFPDALGTTRIAATPVNASTVTIDEDADYYPYGGEIVVSGSSAATKYKFTGKERETETCGANSLCLDYFDARHYASNLGRFMTPDWAAKATAVPYAMFDDPQSLNLYAYVRNNPTNRFDPDGHIDCSGKNALGAGCQAIANWNAEHGISPTAKKSDFPGVPVKLPNGKTIPAGHSTTGVLMSPKADLSDVAAAGKQIRQTMGQLLSSAQGGGAALGYLASALKSDLKQNRDFDYQRASFVSGDLQQLPQFRDVSNFNVGLLGQQAGLSQDELLTIVGLYARLNSSNYRPDQPYGLDPQTRELTVLGYQVGASGAYGP